MRNLYLYAYASCIDTTERVDDATGLSTRTWNQRARAAPFNSLLSLVWTRVYTKYVLFVGGRGTTRVGRVLRGIDISIERVVGWFSQAHCVFILRFLSLARALMINIMFHLRCIFTFVSNLHFFFLFFPPSPSFFSLSLSISLFLSFLPTQIFFSLSFSLSLLLTIVTAYDGAASPRVFRYDYRLINYYYFVYACNHR